VKLDDLVPIPDREGGGGGPGLAGAGLQLLPQCRLAVDEYWPPELTAEFGE